MALAFALLFGCSHTTAPSPPQTSKTSAMAPSMKPRRVLPTTPPGGQPPYVVPSALEALRVAGTKDVVPDEGTQALMSSNDATNIIGSFKVCTNETGELTAVETLQSTGYPAYDEEILNAIDTWRYEPYRVLDRAVPVCTAVMFTFRPQRTRPETPRERALREWDEEQARKAR